CTLGSLPVINKFFPFYKTYLKPEKNDLPFLSLVFCLIGFLIMCLAGVAMKDLIVRKFSGKSPLFVQYSYLVYPFAFSMLLFLWLESFSWSFKKGIVSNGLKEIAVRLVFTFLLVFLAYHLININLLLNAFLLSYILPAVILFIVLRRTKKFKFNTTLSQVTLRLKGRMINFGLFVFGAQFLNLLSRTVDTFILSAKSPRGLSDAAVFTIATYVVTLMEVPQRSINAITIPVLAESWKNKDMDNIRHVYSKSVSNLLVIGLIMFSIFWLNVHNLASYLGKDFSGIEKIVLLMGVGKLIDLGTGANSQIIGTSNYWKVDFTTNVIYTILALPLNYILISRYGLIGAAYSSLISITFYNIMRFGFLWYKFHMQPYTLQTLLVVIVAVVSTAITYYLPRNASPVFDTIFRTTVFLAIFVPVIYFTHISEEINGMIVSFISRVRTIIFKK
ncbi:MAG: polysaccharide biosynthesis C-terminal domain-containing protein, partial [Bacteroidota bacterium]|nr:polysaccharide biosynthesis C-terminal domain-containing protein [Bacteroidota bacterium]